MEINNDNIFGVDPVVEDGQVEEENTVEEQEEESTPDDGQVEEEVETDDKNDNDEVQVQEEESQSKEELLLGKFKSQDDLVNAYKNLEREFTKLKQGKKTAPNEEQPSDDNTQSQDDEYEQRLIKWYNEKIATGKTEDMLEANSVLAQHMAQKELNSYKQQIDQQLQPILGEREQNEAIKATAGKHEDFWEYKQQVTEELEVIAEEEPELLNDPRLYEIAYYRAKSNMLQKKMEEAFENGKKAALNNKAEKKKISNEKAKGSKEISSLPEGVIIVDDGDGIFM